MNRIQNKNKHCLPVIVGLLSFLWMGQIANAQVSGTVFRDFNANGQKDNTAAFNEPFVQGVTVTAYDVAGLSTTTITDASGAYSFTGLNLPLRVEFSGYQAGDYTAPSGSGNASSVQFYTAASSAANFGVLGENGYSNLADNPFVFVPISHAGDPITGTGTSTSQEWFVGYPYNNSGNSSFDVDGSGNPIPNPPPKTLDGSVIGNTWGVAYSKQAKKVFTAAFLKRYCGLGSLGSGGIYMLTPTANSFTVNNFYDMDANGHRTRAISTSFGVGNSFTLNNGGASSTAATFIGAIDPVSGFPEGLGVIGTNAERGLINDITAPSNDPAAFQQVGKVGIGNIEISADGKFLFVMNLYQRKLFRLELDNAFNPTAVIAVSSYALPAVTCNNGELRPFALKYAHNKVYVGAVCSGENGGQNIVGGATDLYAYIFQMDNPTTTSPAFQTSATLSFPLNYQKGNVFETTSNPNDNQWYPWKETTTKVDDDFYTSPMLSDIDFNERGDMILSICDRIGHQWGTANRKDLSGTNNTDITIGGDILIAGYNPLTNTYTLENNGSIVSSGQTYTGMTNNEGPGGGEFFHRDNVNVFSTFYHSETSQGALATVLGTETVHATVIGPRITNSGGTRRFSVVNGDLVDGYHLYDNYGKANGLGDIELSGELPAIEIGNRVWSDDNGNGIQDAGEAGIGGIPINIYNGATQVGTTTTSADGTWYFNTTNVTMNGATGLLPNTAYTVSIPSASFPSGLNLTTQGSATGQPDVRDSDASLVSGNAQIAYTTGSAGQNDHTLDIGFRTQPPCAVTNPAVELCTGDEYTVNLPVGTTGNIQWYKDGSPIAGATNDTLIITTIGIYTAIVTDGSTGCTAPGCCPVEVVAGTNCCTPSVPVLAVTNNTCSPVTAGSISVTTACGAGYHTEFSTNNGTSWSSTIPTYGTTAITVIARCVKDGDPSCFSANSTPVTTVPVYCCPTGDCVPVSLLKIR